MKVYNVKNANIPIYWASHVITNMNTNEEFRSSPMKQPFYLTITVCPTMHPSICLLPHSSHSVTVINRVSCYQRRPAVIEKQCTVCDTVCVWLSVCICVWMSVHLLCDSLIKPILFPLWWKAGSRLLALHDWHRECGSSLHQLCHLVYRGGVAWAAAC